MRSSFNILHVLVVVALCLEPCVFSFEPPMQRCNSKTRANLFPVRGCGAELLRISKTRANLFPVRRCGAKLPSRLVTIATSGSLQAPASLGSLDCVALSLTPCSRHSSSPFLCLPISPPSPLCPLHPFPSPHRLVYNLDLLLLFTSIISPLRLLLLIQLPCALLGSPGFCWALLGSSGAF